MIQQCHSSKQRKRNVLTRCLKTARDEVEVTSIGKLFRMFAPATRKARCPTVDNRRTTQSAVADLSLHRVGISVTRVNCDARGPDGNFEGDTCSQ